MQVHDAIDAIVALLQSDPILHRPEPVADVQLAGRLNPREYAWHGPNLPGSMEGSKTVSALDLLHLARTAAEAAAGYLRAVERPSDPADWTHKGSRDFVTEVDRTAERMITDILVAAEPGSRIVGEELSPEVVRDGLVWIVDPLDGTTNFLHGFPAYAVSIAAAVDGELEAAVVVQVPRHEVYTAARGAGAWQGDRRLAVSAIADPGFALIGTGSPFKETSRLGEYLAQFARVAARTRCNEVTRSSTCR